MSKRRKLEKTSHKETHLNTHFDKLPKDVVGLLRNCIEDNRSIGVWVYWIQNDRVSNDVFDHLKFIRASNKQEAFIRILENDWELFLRDYIVPARQLFEEFVESHKHLIRKDDEKITGIYCDCERWYSIYGTLLNPEVFAEPKKAEFRFSRSLCALACKEHFRKEFQEFMRKALLPPGKTEVWTDLMNDLISQRKLRLRSVSKVYNPNINKSFE